MRTTVSLDGHLLELAKREAAVQHRSFASLVEEALRQIEGLKSQKEKYAAQISAMQETLEQTTKQSTNYENELTEIMSQLQFLQPQRLQSVEKLTTTLKEIGRDLTVLIDEFSGIQMQIK